MTGAGADGGSPTTRPFDVREADLGVQFTAFIDGICSGASTT
ncbi:hypothetical protein [Brevibacterium permense]|nr:hypothetical protein [Brevibacterium permense]